MRMISCQGVYTIWCRSFRVKLAFFKELYLRMQTDFAACWCFCFSANDSSASLPTPAIELEVRPMFSQHFVASFSTKMWVLAKPLLHSASAALLITFNISVEKLTCSILVELHKQECRFQVHSLLLKRSLVGANNESATWKQWVILWNLILNQCCVFHYRYIFSNLANNIVVFV